MVKILSILFILNLSFANNSLRIFENYFNNSKRMDESLKPSFDCSKVKEFSVEERICIIGGQAAPTLIFIDNFFTSYYDVIMKHTPKDKKQEVKNIARKAMRKRYENYKHNSCNKELSSVGQTLCENDTIFEAYSLGVKELSQYLLQNDETLLDKIFSNYAKEIVNFGISEQMLDSLYKDKLIDETGKLIVKIDSKEEDFK